MARSPKRGRQIPFVGVGQLPGVLTTSPGGLASSITFEALAALLGGLLGGHGYWSPLTAGGDPTTAELIFTPEGDTVDVFIPFD